jgi:putative ABC transport system ATP-binding protein
MIDSQKMVERDVERSEMRFERLVDAQGIGRRAPGTGAWLLHEISLSTRGGDRLALTGPSGAGKTLLLRALAMLDPIDTGSILWRDAPVESALVPVYRSQVMYLHQRSALVPGTVADNLQRPFTLKVFRDRRFDKDRVIELLAIIGRGPEFLNKFDRDLSGGERQLVALLRAIQLDPVVLLLDEPTAALDATTRLAVEGLVAQWLADSPQMRSTVWVTHDAEQSLRVADRALTMQDGRLIGET